MILTKHYTMRCAFLVVLLALVGCQAQFVDVFTSGGARGDGFGAGFANVFADDDSAYGTGLAVADSLDDDSAAYGYFYTTSLSEDDDSNVLTVGFAGTEGDAIASAGAIGFADEEETFGASFAGSTSFDDDAETYGYSATLVEGEEGDVETITTSETEGEASALGLAYGFADEDGVSAGSASYAVAEDDGVATATGEANVEGDK